MKRRLQLDMRRELGHDKEEKIVTPQGLSPRDWKKHVHFVLYLDRCVSMGVCVCG